MFKFTLACLLALFFSYSCGNFKSYLHDANIRMESGDFDGAMILFEKAARVNREDPTVMYGMGMLLSLKRVSLYSSLSLLEGSYNLKPDTVKRKELLVIYLDVGLFDKAKELLMEKKTDISVFFSPEMEMYRKGVECIESPNKKNLELLKTLERTPLRDYLLGRCFIEAKRFDDAEAIYTGLKGDIIGCELLASWPPVQFAGGSYSDTMGECRKLFPGSVIVNRERPPDVRVMDYSEKRKLFPNYSEKLSY